MAGRSGGRCALSPETLACDIKPYNLVVPPLHEVVTSGALSLLLPAPPPHLPQHPAALPPQPAPEPRGKPHVHPLLLLLPPPP